MQHENHVKFSVLVLVTIPVTPQHNKSLTG